MGFDLYFASQDDGKNIDWYYENDFNLLYSQVNNRKFIHKRFEAKTNGLHMIDSGAHSAHTKGVEIDLAEYIDFLNSYEDKIDIYVQVDKIPGKYLQEKTIKDWQEAPKISWENYLYMREELKNPDKLIPIFHQGEDFKWLENMCNAKFKGEPIPYIGLSPRGDVSLKSKYDFCADCFGVIQKSSNPNVKTHAFGMTSLELLEKLPFYSADSTTYLMVCAFGQVWTPWGKIGVSEENKKHPTATQVYYYQTDEIKKKLDDYFESIGTSVEKLSVSHGERAKMSALYCKNWADNYVYKGPKTFVKSAKLF